ncbi:hydrogenase maturation nickel metallochaperone HypA [Phenylobacterium sp.]|uniref:hydrogenase maturation nickel metallochaperone HypA/HybF n=1 Tax=Phenylobacterium sp. TaxID=1871053 RepID=UPI0035AEAE95
MHEASLMKGLMRRIEEIAAAQDARRVTGVSVWLGALSHFSVDHFAEHFEEASAGTIAEGARLEATLSDDISDPNAQDVMLRSIEVET